MANPYQQIGRNILQPSPLSALPVEAEADPGQKIERLKSLLTEENWFTPFGEKIRSLINSFSEGGLPPAPLPGSATAPPPGSFPGGFFAGTVGTQQGAAEARAAVEAQQSLRLILARQREADRIEIERRDLAAQQEHEQAVKAQQDARNRFLSQKDKVRAMQAQVLTSTPDVMHPNQLPPEVANIVAMNQAAQAQQQQAPVPSPILPEPQGPPPIFPEPNAPTQELINEITQLASNQILPEPGGAEQFDMPLAFGSGEAFGPGQAILPPADGQTDKIEEKMRAELDAIKAKRKQGEAEAALETDAAELARAQAATAREPEPEPEVVAPAEPETVPEPEVAPVISEDGTEVSTAEIAQGLYKKISAPADSAKISPIEKYIDGPVNPKQPVVPKITKAGVRVVPTDPADPKAPNADINKQKNIKTKNSALNQLQNQLRKELKSLTKVKDPDSVQPFWNWLSDFSAGMRAAAKAGDQTLGAVAAGFENVRRGAKERTALEAASRQAAIGNIKDLGSTIEDIAGTVGKDYGQWGTSAGQWWGIPTDKTTGQSLPPSGMATPDMMRSHGFNSNTENVFWTTDKQQNVKIQVVKKEPGKQITLWTKNNDGLLTGNSEQFVVGSAAHTTAINNPDKYTTVEPETQMVLATKEEKKNLLGKNAELFEKVGSLIYLKKKGNKILDVEIKNLPKGVWLNLHNPTTGMYRLVNKTIPNAVDNAIRDGFSVEMNIQSDQPPRNKIQQYRGEIESSRAAIKMIERIRTLAADKTVVGTAAAITRQYQNWRSIVSDFSEWIPELGSVVEDYASDDASGNIDEVVRDWFDKDLTAVGVLRNSIIYKFAKALKGNTGRLNSDDIKRAEKALHQDKESLKGQDTIISALEAAIPVFNERIASRYTLLNREMQNQAAATGDPSRINKTYAKREGSVYTKHVGILKGNPTPAFQRFFNKWYGPGASANVLGIQ